MFWRFLDNIRTESENRETSDLAKLKMLAIPIALALHQGKIAETFVIEFIIPVTHAEICKISSINTMLPTTSSRAVTVTIGGGKSTRQSQRNYVNCINKTIP